MINMIDLNLISDHQPFRAIKRVAINSKLRVHIIYQGYNIIKKKEMCTTNPTYVNAENL